MFAREGNESDIVVLNDMFACIYELGDDTRIYEGRRVAGVLHEHDAICELSVGGDGELVFPPMDHVPDDEREPTPTIWDY